jgi:hypothetical protein
MAFDLLARVRANPLNARILDGLADIGLPDCWLVAGCLYQTCWNLASGRPVDEGITDYDVFYFDDSDLSWEAEDREIRRLARLYGPAVELRNEARVHLWYAERFGPGYPRLASARDGIDRFPVAGTCIGIGWRGGRLEVHAPFGLDDMVAGVLRPNPLNPREDLFRMKAESYRRRWPWLRISDEPASLVPGRPLN